MARSCSNIGSRVILSCWTGVQAYAGHGSAAMQVPVALALIVDNAPDMSIMKGC